MPRTRAHAFLSRFTFVYYIIDLFGKGALVTDSNFGTTSPLPQSSRTELFSYVESQLKEAEAALPAAIAFCAEALA